MGKLILPMGAEHTDHDKLINIINTIECQARTGLFTNPIINQDEYDRINDLYKDRADVPGGIIPKYQCVTYVDEEKIDGFSYTCDNGEFFSRKLSEARGSEGTPICKTGHVPHLSATFKTMAIVCDFDLHGELYKPGGTSDDVTKIMGCAEDKAVTRQKYPNDRLHYMVHDIRRFMEHDLTNEPWYVRRAILEYFFEGYTLENPFVHISRINGSPVRSFNGIVSSGGEGIMIKRTSGLYVPGKKPANNWIKCKKEVTLDVAIMGLDYNGSGKNANLFKSITVGLWDGNELKPVGQIHSGISDTLRKDIYINISRYMHKVIEVDAMEFNDKSWSLRHGRLVRFRDDKSVEQCTPDGLKLKCDII